MINCPILELNLFSTLLALRFILLSLRVIFVMLLKIRKTAVEERG